MDQQPACTGISGDNVLENVFKIALRLFRGPSRGAWGQFLQVEASVVLRMATVAAGVSRPLLQKDRFDSRFKCLETGGIAPKILPALTDGRFLRAFRAKRPFESLLAAMPVKVVLNTEVALLGAAVFAARL
jgi:hypothetical protein